MEKAYTREKSDCKGPSETESDKIVGGTLVTLSAMPLPEVAGDITGSGIGAEFPVSAAVDQRSDAEVPDGANGHGLVVCANHLLTP